MLKLQIRNEDGGAVMYDSNLPFRLDFNATGIREITQNIVVLMLTPIMSQGLDRELGLDMSFVDRPIPVARNMLVAEITERLHQFEDRVEIADVEFLPAQSEAGHLYAALVLRFDL